MCFSLVWTLYLQKSQQLPDTKRTHKHKSFYDHLSNKAGLAGCCLVFTVHLFLT